ncbi:transporter substrate-binding domain-containing protein [Blautia sp. MSJ-19]|nr:transporter substrate-binding domain-containing protein [Blautia sp. MSJ-19]MBU5479743.1 transporter substrate-binding domain-containing protein [Blautia sp. MSJ-19]
MILTAATGCAKQTENTTNDSRELQEIIVGSDDYPPFNYADENGNPTGIDVNLATEAFKRIGYEAVFTRINWEDKKKLVESGDIDCIWGSFTINGRENEYKWAGPYMISHQVVAVEKDSDIYTFGDLEGKRIAVQSTTKPEEIFASHSDSRIPKFSEVFSLQNRELIYPFLSKGYVDAVAAHETAILQYMKDYDLEYRILEEPLLTVGLGVAFSKNDDRGIEKELTETFKEMRADGSAEKIIGKYLDHAETYLEVEDYE